MVSKILRSLSICSEIFADYKLYRNKEPLVDMLEVLKHIWAKRVQSVKESGVTVCKADLITIRHYEIIFFMWRVNKYPILKIATFLFSHTYCNCFKRGNIRKIERCKRLMFLSVTTRGTHAKSSRNRYCFVMGPHFPGKTR